MPKPLFKQFVRLAFKMNQVLNQYDLSKAKSEDRWFYDVDLQWLKEVPKSDC